jgi:Na+-driven multidrug efflux pump
MSKILVLLVTIFWLGSAFGTFTPHARTKDVMNSNIRSLLQGTSLSSTASNNDQEKRRDILRGGGLTEDIEPLPTMRDYRKFALPCLALWVVGPLLSLVDTAFVGLSGDSALSAGQIAALGPATTFFDGATYLFAFLNVASTNLYSSARAQYGETSPNTESVVRTAARTALLSGFVVMALLLAFARPLLALYIGEYLSFYIDIA